MIFQTVRNLVSSLGASSRIGELVQSEVAARSAHGASTHADRGLRVLLVSDRGVVASGGVKTAEASLRDAGASVSIFDDVMPDPHEECVVAAAAQAVRDGADAVVGVGGGSPLDVAKLAAFLAANPGAKLQDAYGVGRLEAFGDGVRRRLPLVLVPTTAGTGSEATPVAIVTTGAETKAGVVSPQLLPDWAVLDARLTASVPRRTAAHAGVDAMVHAVEAYTCATRKNPASDALAREALRLLSGSIRSAAGPDGAADHDARADMLLGSALAGMSFANAPVAAVHALAYPIGARHGVPHGLSCSLMLPAVLAFNAEDGGCAALYGELADIAFPRRAAAGSGPVAAAGSHALGSAGEGAARLRDGFVDLIRDLGLPARLSDPAVGVREEDLSALAADALRQERLLPNNPRPVSEADAVAMYQSIF
jgi:alcohol dehydrogenase class IV